MKKTSTTNGPNLNKNNKQLEPKSVTKIRDPSSSPTRPVIDVLDHQLEQLAGELLKRRNASQSPVARNNNQTAGRPANNQSSPESKAVRKNSGKKPVQPVKPIGAESQTKAVKRNQESHYQPSKQLQEKARLANAGSSMLKKSGSIISMDEDPGKMLTLWLGELDSVQKDPQEPITTMAPSNITRQTSPSPSNVSSSTSNSTGTQIRRMSTPRVDSPRLDSYRYSLINLEDTLENDLDTILGELCELETQFSRTKDSPDRNDTPTALPPPPAPLQLEELLASEPQYISPESVRQNKAVSKRTDSPDTDSAFCENTSSNSSSSSEKQRQQMWNSLNVKSSHQVSPDSVKSSSNKSDDSAAKAKAEKIRLAIEKIKEASIKKIFIKVFGEDGSTKSLLVDERMSVAQVCRMLAEKNHIKRDTNWGLVELLPDLHMERAFEDHESLVENLLMWKADSKNTLWFIKRAEVYDIFNRPEVYLLGDTSSQIGTDMEDRARAELIEEYFSSTGVGAPEMEGFLWLKTEGKKTWKKFYFVLRTSGLYYAPKGKKSSKDLVCLARFDVNQVYFGVKWMPKFKSPSKHCFAIKHPQIQAKNPKYIRYLCADSELELNKWVTGIRLAKYGKTLYENYRGIIEEIAHEDIDRLASARHSIHSNQHNVTAELPSSQYSQISDTTFDSQIPVTTTTVIVHSNPSIGVKCRSSRSSSTSMSDRSTNGNSTIEHGFSCDSPEGGTIKKKPQVKSSLVTFKPDNEKSSGNKGVRFKDTYSTIPVEDDDDLPPPPHREQTYATMRRPVQQHQNEHFKSLLKPLDMSQNEQYVYRNIDSILNNHKIALQNTMSSQDQHQHHPIKRRYSNESLVSNPAMLHTGTVLSPTTRSPSPPDPIMTPSNNEANNLELSPQPIRPAPVLKPQVSRKPSLDRSMLQRKHQQIIEGSNNNNSKQHQPTYEETLKKCQSLTGGSNGDSKPQQTVPKPGSPAIPPKPILGGKITSSPHGHLDNGTKIAHLPPSGLGHRNGRSQSASRNNGFLNDLERAMNHRNKVPSREEMILPQSVEEARPFPNRFSSGEYENANVNNNTNVSSKVCNGHVGSGKPKLPAPPLPKRNEETHLSWKRS